MNKYEDKSDSQINVYVHLIVDFEWKDSDELDVPNYCEDPSVSWPIITENHISIIHIPIIGTDRYRYSASIGAGFMTLCMSPDGSDNGVLTFRDDYNYIDENNPLRAMMIVYLMMMEQKRG